MSDENEVTEKAPAKKKRVVKKKAAAKKTTVKKAAASKGDSAKKESASKSAGPEKSASSEKGGDAKSTGEKSGGEKSGGDDKSGGESKAQSGGDQPKQNNGSNNQNQNHNHNQKNQHVQNPPGTGKRRRRKKKNRGGGNPQHPHGGGGHSNEPPYEPDPEKEEIRLWELQDKTKLELIALGEELEIQDPEGLGRYDLVFEIMKAYAREKHPLRARGIMEALSDGFGFLRFMRYNFDPCQEDIYVAPNLIRRHGLRSGDSIIAELRPARSKERFFALAKIIEINERSLEDAKKKIPFKELTPLFPEKRAVMENSAAKKDDVSMRVVDLVSPIGFGQRAIIVAPPRTGKTVLMQKMANAISENNPDSRLIILLVDERPEEVTDMRRTTKAEVIASTFDEHASRHVQVAEIVIEMAKRDVENGKNVVILLDSITRLARAYNTVAPHSGRILTGGVDANALHKPRRFFAAARNIEEGGSLTIIATALVDTGSRMDEVIFEEFKGTGNLELHLDRSLVDKRVYPAINIERSGTRKEELLMHPDELNAVWVLRKALNGVPPVEAMELLISKLKKSKTNAEFLMNLTK